MLTETVLQYQINAIKQKRSFYRCFRLYLRIPLSIFPTDPSSLFIALEKGFLWIFWNFQKSTQEKQRDGV